MHRLDVGLDPRCNPVDASVLHELTRRGLSLPQSVSERFDCDVLADVTAMFEAVGNGFRDAIDWHIDAFDPDVLDPRRQDISSRPNDLEPQALGVRRTCLVWYGHPHGVWQLSRQLMMAKRTNEADDAVWYKACGLREIMSGVLTDSFRVLVETASETDDIAGIGKALQIDKRDARCCEVTRARDPAVSDETEGALAMCHTISSHIVTYCRQKY
ncbi:hypothetical protein ACVME8_009537 [Bradyrhizobium diazoefficiens]